MAETEAGRRFLQTLHRSHDLDEMEVMQLASIQKISPTIHHVVDIKTKRNALRDTLEELIVEYLKTLSSFENTFNDISHRKRKRRELMANNDNLAEPILEDNISENSSDISEGQLSGAFSDNATNNVVNNASANYKIVPKIEISDGNEEYDGGSGRGLISTKVNCSHHRRRVTQLDQYEMEKSILNHSETEQNIRRILNNRCEMLQ